MTHSQFLSPITPPKPVHYRLIEQANCYVSIDLEGEAINAVPALIELEPNMLVEHKVDFDSLFNHIADNFASIADQFEFKSDQDYAKLMGLINTNRLEQGKDLLLSFEYKGVSISNPTVDEQKGEPLSGTAAEHYGDAFTSWVAEIKENTGHQQCTSSLWMP